MAPPSSTGSAKVTPIRNDAFRMDGWTSALTGIGKALYDKRLSSTFESTELSLEETEEFWAGDDMAARIIETVPEECLRQGFELQVADAPDIAEAMMATLDEVDAVGHLQEAMCYARAYGGGAILLGADDGQEPSKPLELSRVRSLGWMMVLGPRELEVATQYGDPARPKFGEAETYRIRPSTDTGGVRLNSRLTVHESRLIRFHGQRISRRRQQRLGGWGESVLTRCWPVVRDFQNAWSGVSVGMADLVQTVWKIKGLAELLLEGHDEAVVTRAQMLDMARSVARALLTDADDTFERQVVNFTGVDTMLQQFALRLAAAARMPVSLLMGQAPAGLNATGDSDVRWFYDSVKTQQNRVLRPALNRLVEVLFNAKLGPTAGREPDNWTVKFNPLWQLSDSEQADLRNKQADTDSKYIAAGVLMPEEVAASRFGGDAYSTETKLDLEARERFALEEAAASEGDVLEEEAELQTSAKAPVPGTAGPVTRGPFGRH